MLNKIFKSKMLGFVNTYVVSGICDISESIMTLSLQWFPNRLSKIHAQSVFVLIARIN